MPQTIITEWRDEVVLDKAGYFVIVPIADSGLISVEHYAYDNTLLHSLAGREARSLCLTIIQNGWVSELTHAAYLGRELARAESALKHGLPYVQDAA